MSFSDNFIHLRKREKLTQEELAERFGVSRQAVSKWETGDAYPEMDKLLAICDFFQVPLNDLVHGDLRTSTTQLQDTDEPSEEESNALSAGQIQGVVNGLTFFLCIGFYFLLGIVFHAWHPTWIIFLLIPLVACLSTCWGSKNKIRGGISGAVLFASIIVYLLCGFYARLWQVMWLLFLLVPITNLLLTIFKN